MIGLTTILKEKGKRLRNQMHNTNLFSICIDSNKDIQINIWREKIITISFNCAEHYSDLFNNVLCAFIGFSLYYSVYFNSYYQGNLH